MEDDQIIALFWHRSEDAIARTAEKYGGYCMTIAANILPNREDAEECVSDTWLAAWQNIPPQHPAILRSSLGRSTRNLSLKRWREISAEKRGKGQMPVVLEELAECIPSGERVEDLLEARELGQILNDFLALLPDAERHVFLRRYWHLMPTRAIAVQYGFTDGRVRTMLCRIRSKLRNYLNDRGVFDENGTVIERIR